jgi:hypothetical protein
MKTIMQTITAIEVLQGYRLSLTFDDGASGIVDLSHLAGKGVFARWLDRKQFEQVRIGSVGELVWGDDLDLCPDSLYLQVTGKKPEDIFPILCRDSAHA